jgi:prevent-host-death family protein
MQIVNIHEAKTRLSALLADVEKTGQTVRICRNGKAVADLVPHRHRDRLSPHPVMGRLTLDYDPVEPLASDEWPEQER